jgi:hypothetical protein
MSDLFAKRRPMIDWEEFERGLREPHPTDHGDGESLAELLRIIRGNDESHEADFAVQRPAQARPDAREPGEWKQPHSQENVICGDFAAIEAGLLGATQPQAAILPEAETANAEPKQPDAQVPLISGDFAAIEAGLLGLNREQAAAVVAEPEVPNAFPNVDLRSERSLYQDNTLFSHNGGVADGQIRLRRPLYIMAAIVVAGLAGIAASLAFRSGVPGPPEIATIKAENGPTKLQTETANVPAQGAAILSKPPEPSPGALLNNTEQSLDLSQAEESAPPAGAPPGSQAPIDNGPPAVSAAPAQTQTAAESVSITAPIEPEKTTTDFVRPNGAPLSKGTPPQANVSGAPLPAPRPAGAAKPRTAKTAVRAARPPNSAATTQSGGHGRLRQIANNAKATPVSQDDAKADAPTTQPNPETNGPFGLMQSAVNSLANTTAKLLQWGRIEAQLGP